MNMQSSGNKNLGLDRDAIWSQLRDEARSAVQDEPLLGALIHAGLLHHHSLEGALGQPRLTMPMVGWPSRRPKRLSSEMRARARSGRRSGGFMCIRRK